VTEEPENDEPEPPADEPVPPEIPDDWLDQKPFDPAGR
jgi:hypothetical protein